MAQLAFGVGGAAIGSQFGQAGLGFAAGTLVYSFINPPDDIIQEGQRLNNQLTTTSAYGVMRPIIYGTMPVSGNIIDGSDLYEKKHKEKQDSSGKGGIGGGQEVVNITYTYSIDLAIGLGEGPIEDVIKIYANEKLIYDISPNSTVNAPDWLKITIYKGTEDQMPDPTFQVLHGEDTPAYRGEAYVVFTRFELQDFGNQIPSFRFLVVKQSTPLQSEDQKAFAGAGNIGAVLYDRYTTLLYYASSGQSGTRAGFVYDPRAEADIISLRWSNDYIQFDEAGGGGLFSVPTITPEGLVISQGPNAHFFINVETASSPALAIYETKTGSYLGVAPINVTLNSNTLTLISDERSGIVFKENEDASSFFSYLDAYSVFSGIIGITVTHLGQVQIPIANRDGINEWDWNAAPSYPEGTTREGKIIIHGVDLVSNVDYLYIIDDSDPLVYEVQITPTEYAFNNITAICWDSTQQYFWVMGESDTTSNTRLKAYDLSGAEQASYEWANSLYTISKDYFTYDVNTFSIWLFDSATGELFQFDTINGEFVNTFTGFTAGTAGTGDSLVYVNSTRSAWRKKGLGLLDIYRLGRISESGVGLDVIVDDLCKRAELDSGEYDVTDLASVTVSGYKIDKDGDIRSKLIPLQQAYLFDGVDKADLIDFKFRGPPVEDTIPERDLGATNGISTGENFIEINRVMDLNLPKKTEITYYNKDQEYESNTQMARRTASYLKENSSRITLPVVLTDDEGAKLADIIQHLPYIEREVYDIKVLPKWQYLVSGDVINIEYDNRTFTARIINKDFEDGIVSFKCTREESSILQSFLNGGSASARTVQIEYNPLTNSVHLDIPLLLERNDNAGYYLSACGMGDNWTGGNIYKSPDGNSFNIAGTALTPSVIGSMDQALPGVALPDLWDRTSVARVYMACGELFSVTEEQALQGENIFALGAHGRWEIIAIVNATPVEPKVYDCDTFLRGLLGTEWAIGTHQVGDTLCQLSTDDLTYINDSLVNLNTRFLYRAVSLGGNIYSDRVVDQFHTNTGVCLKPYSVANLQATKNPVTLDITFTWEARTRYPWANFWSGVPSDPNNFQIDIPVITPSPGTRTVSNITTEQYIYTRADQLTDGYPADDLIVDDFDVYHISDSVGRGYVATVQTSVGPDPHPMLTYAQTIGATTIWQCNDSYAATPAEDIITDIFTNYEIDLADTRVTEYILGASSILPGSTKTCVELQNFGRGVSNPIASAQGMVDVIDFSMLLIYRPLEAITTDAQPLNILYLDPGGSEVDVVILRRRSADGSIEAVHNNGSGEPVTINNGANLTNGVSVQLIVTFSATSIGTFGDFKFYINGQLIGTQSARAVSSDATSTQRFAIGYAAQTEPVQTEQHRQSHIMLFDHALTQQEVTNLFVTSGL